MKPYSYIGNGEVKYLDKAETKMGAFFHINIDTLWNELIRLRNDNPDISEIMIYALPNKSGTHSVKLKL